MQPATAKAKAPARHVHLHIDLDPETETLQYRAIVTGEHTILHRNETITFTSKDPFSILFEKHSPFVPASKTSFDAQLDSGAWIVTARVRGDTPYGRYPYTMRMTKLGQVFQHEGETVKVLESDPEIIIEQL